MEMVKTLSNMEIVHRLARKDDTFGDLLSAIIYWIKLNRNDRDLRSKKAIKAVFEGINISNYLN